MKIMKRITIILILLVIGINTFSFAVENPDTFNPGTISDTDAQEAGKLIGNILGTIKVIGICIACVMLTVIGLKYIISSVDEKANYKQNMVPYIVGCLLLTSATVIPSLVYDLVNK